MASSGREGHNADEAVQAGFKNPFSEDPSSGSSAGSKHQDVDPQSTRSVAEQTALENGVPPSDSAAFAGSPVADSGGMPQYRRISEASVRPELKEKDSKDSTSSKNTISKLSTQGGSSTEGSSAENHEHGEILERGQTLERVRTVATKIADRFRLSSLQESRPFAFFNPTSVRAHLERVTTRGQTSDTGFDILWRARDNRKRRGSIAVSTTGHKSRRRSRTQKAKTVLRNVWRMFTTFPYWDMAFWGGWSYAIGSVLFVVDGIFAWLPVAFPEAVFYQDNEYAVPLCFFFGACFYQIGGTMALFEAINDGSFHGSAMRRLLEGREDEQKKMLDAKLRSFFDPRRRRVSEEEAELEQRHADVDPEAGWNTKDQPERPGSIYAPKKRPAPRRGAVDLGETAAPQQGSTYLTWRWYPSWHALKHHHSRDLGFIAVSIQLFGVSLYTLTGILILPGIMNTWTTTQVLGGYWVLQVVAAICFLTASIMFTLETQEKWYKPEPGVLGWWIGVWAAIGSVGFELIAIFGIMSGKHWASYQSNLSDIWGSTGYLISSLLQWYEAISKDPEYEEMWEPGEMKSWQVHPL